MNISVSATGLCSQNINLPCATVTVCAPGSTTHCQQISDILIDTGSYGLRIFSQAIPQNLCNALPINTDAQGREVAECAQFGTATDWGPVASADVQLGGETPVNVPIQIIHHSFGTASAACGCAENSPSSAGINGILGVGFRQQDCGTACVVSPNIGFYYGCNGSSCGGTAVALAQQVQNPVALLSSDKNGVILNFGAVGANGAPGAVGTMTLGIDTLAGNNSSAGATKYKANASGYLSTTFNGKTFIDSFIDSGSNALILTAAGISQCGSNEAGFYCPTSTQNLSATITGSGGSGSSNVNFSIANMESLLNTGNTVFNNAAAVAPSGFGQSFDWGFPFFLGRKVYVGIEGQSSNLGAGPYWAF